METPSKLVLIGVLQLVSGLVNLFVMSWVVGCSAATAGSWVSAIVLAVCTLGMCPLPIGVVCGFAGVGLGIVGLLETISGIVVLASPQSSRSLLRFTAVLEVLSLLAGGITSAIVGVLVLVFAGDEQVRAFQGS